MKPFHRLLEKKTAAPPTRLRLLFSVFILILSPVVVFQCAEWFTHNPWTIMTWKVALWNVLFYEMVYLLLFFLTGRILAACLIGDLFFLIFSLANYYVVQFRSNPIVPWDFFSIGTAASVARDYSYKLSLQAGICVGIHLLLLVLALFCRGRIRALLPRGLAVLALCAGLFGYVHLLHTDSFIKSMKLFKGSFAFLYKRPITLAMIFVCAYFFLSPFIKTLIKMRKKS